jgi:CheY-like chemotaxis protein
VACVLLREAEHDAVRRAEGRAMSEAWAMSSGVIECAIDVVVVEDDEDARELIARLLTNDGCRVRAFGTAEAAFAAAQAQVPDVVVTDLVLRARLATGWSLAEMLRREPATRHVALVAVTGQVEPRLDFVRSFDAYLRKPIDGELLQSLVARLAHASREARDQAAAAG